MMAKPKKELFKKDEVELAELAKAISHPARIAILKILAKQKSCICGRIVDDIPLAQSTVSQHLKELKKAGLVRGTIDGVKSSYCLDREYFERAVNQMIQLKELLSRGDDK